MRYVIAVFVIFFAYALQAFAQTPAQPIPPGGGAVIDKTRPGTISDRRIDPCSSLPNDEKLECMNRTAKPEAPAKDRRDDGRGRRNGPSGDVRQR